MIKKDILTLAGMIIIACINIYSYFRLEKNMLAGVYAVDADSLGIPIGITIIASLILIAGVIANRLGPSHSVIGVGIFLMKILAIVTSSLGVIYWWTPHHHSIAALYALFALYMAFFYSDALTNSDNSRHRVETRTAHLLECALILVFKTNLRVGYSDIKLYRRN